MISRELLKKMGDFCNTDTQESIRHYSDRSDLPWDRSDVATSLGAMYSYFCSDKQKSNVKTINGATWEAMIALTLLTAGVDASRIKRQVRGKTSKGHSYDMDFVVEGGDVNWAISCKTSLRERHKIAGYEFTSILNAYGVNINKWLDGEHQGFYCAALFFHEPEKKLALRWGDGRCTHKNINKGIGATNENFLIDIAVSPFDVDAFNHTISCIKKGRPIGDSYINRQALSRRRSCGNGKAK